MLYRSLARSPQRARGPGTGGDVGGGGWIGVDLDGTLAMDERWRGEEHVGAPVPLMVARVKQWLSQGIEVRIFTARASNVTRPGQDVGRAVAAIEAWCEQHIGQRLRVTCEKDFAMIELWDDRCIQVMPNTGELAR